MTDDRTRLLDRIAALEAEVARLRASAFEPSEPTVVRVPPEVAPPFEAATATMRDYFRRIQIDPARALIGLHDERYVLVRASAFSIDFFDTLVQLYADRGEEEARAIARGFLFDIAHTIGLHDARTMHDKLGSRDALEKLSSGPVHFAFTGWATVDIKSESIPVQSEDFCLVYDHPYSFEAASFVRAGRTSDRPVCIMNAGYSSGWCEESFGLELTAVEVTCKAKGDPACRFVMAPPSRIVERVRTHFGIDVGAPGTKGLEIPAYFERKRAEEQLRTSLRMLQDAQDELVRKERLATVGLMVSGVAHEINTPLGVAVTAMSVAVDEHAALAAKFDAGKLTKQDLRHFLERTAQANQLVQANLERAAAQVTNFKRVSVDQVTHERRVIDLGAYVQQTLDTLRPVIRSSRLAIEVVAHGDLVVSTSPGAIAQVLANFVTNTAAHGRGEDADPSSPLDVRIELARIAPDRVRLRYEDRGRGMSSEVAAQAFHPFFTTARGRGGTGLGLHIVHALVVDVLGGRIELDSAPGAGVRFEVELDVGEG